MTNLHTHTEFIAMSNTAHTFEGLALITSSALVLALALGHLRQGKQRFILPGLAVTGGLTLLAILFYRAYDNPLAGLDWINSELQQQQHLWMALALIGGGTLTGLGHHLKSRPLQTTLPLAVSFIGLLFLFHPQHGTGAEATRVVLQHRIAGTSLLFAGLAHATALFYPKYYRQLLFFTATGLILSGSIFVIYREPTAVPAEHPHSHTLEHTYR